MDVQAMEKAIRAILTAPNVDLSTISSKRVRKDLAEQFGAAVVKQNKEAIDALIIEAFNEIALAAGATVKDETVPPAVTSGHAAPDPKAAVTTSSSSSNTAAIKRENQPSTTSNGASHLLNNGSNASASGTSAGVNGTPSRDNKPDAPPSAKRQRNRTPSEASDASQSDDDDASDYSSGSEGYAKARSKSGTKPSSSSSTKPNLKQSPQKRRVLDYEGGQPPSSPAMPLALTTGLTDEEYARQLQEQFNAAAGLGGRATRGGGYQASSSTKKAKKHSKSFGGNGSGKKGKSVKSKAYISDSDLDDDDDDDSSGARKPKAKSKRKQRSDDDSDDDDGSESGKRKKKRAGGTGGGYNKEMGLSEALQTVCGQPTMSRPQVVKALWAYIRENNLQDPAKKSDIVNDNLFKEIFGVERMTMFSMNKYLKKSLFPIP